MWRSLVILSSVSCTLAAFRNNPFGPVSTQYPNSFEYNLLYTYRFVDSTMRCAVQCYKNPNCVTFCRKDGNCKLFSVPVTAKYSGPGYYGGAVVHTYDECYSILGSTLQILEKAIPQKSSNNPNQLAGCEYFPINGYTDFWNIKSIYVSGYQANPWWSAQLPEAYDIYYIYIYTRFTKDMEIRLGNNINFLLNPLVHSTGSTYTLPYILVTLSPPAKGTILSIQLITTGGYLEIGTVVAFRA